MAVESGEPFGGGPVGLGGLDGGAVGPDGCSGDQGEGERVARAGVDLGGALRSVDHDGRVVGTLREAVDADLAQVAAEGLDQPAVTSELSGRASWGPWPGRTDSVRPPGLLRRSAGWSGL